MTLYSMLRTADAPDDVYNKIRIYTQQQITVHLCIWTIRPHKLARGYKDGFYFFRRHSKKYNPAITPQRRNIARFLFLKPAETHTK